VKHDIFWSNIGSSLNENRVAYSHQEFPGITSPHSKLSANKIINKGKQEVVACKKNMRAACQKDKLEFKFFFLALITYTKKDLQYRFLYATFKKKYID